MDVNSIGPLSGGQPIRKVAPTVPAQKPVDAKPVSPKDELEISSASSVTSAADVESAFRAQRVAQIQQQIADGTYETPEKLETAVDRLLQRLLSE